MREIKKMTREYKFNCINCMKEISFNGPDSGPIHFNTHCPRCGVLIELILQGLDEEEDYDPLWEPIEWDTLG